MEGNLLINKHFFGKFFFFGQSQRIRPLFSVWEWQSQVLNWLKSGRRIRFVHWFRQYSALAMVVSSVFMVTGTNIALSRSAAGIPFGSFLETPVTTSAEHNQFALTASVKNNLAFVPLASASATVDPGAKDDTTPFLTQSGDQFAVIAQSSPVLKDPEEDGGVKIYTVQQGDTVSMIAARNNITINTILWANDMDNVDAIKPGDQIFILPVAGLSYTVKEGDTTESVAKQFGADGERIIAFNSLPANGRLETGQQIMIPDGRRAQENKPTSDTLTPRRQYATSDDASSAANISGKSITSGRAGTGHRFPYGYCTWYVAQKRYVPWGGNAGTWLYNAKALGYKTGKAPTPGAIVVTTDSAYYGHVALVESVSGGMITVSEMNYKGWGKVNRRTLPANARSIKGYIY